MHTTKEALRYLNLSIQELTDHALKNKEGVLSANGALSVTTGKRTGRSPRDRFIVDDGITKHTVDWGKVNLPISQEHFTVLWNKAIEYSKSLHSLYENTLSVGADNEEAINVNVITEFAWHSLFAKHLFISTTNRDIKNNSQWTILNMPGLVLDPKVDGTPSDGTVIINFTEQKVLLCGMRYAGEMKKAMFTVMNFMLPEKDILPMHCAANKGDDDSVALFFGLSGTGKTTLSADQHRQLIGDDEHGWSSRGVFNFEGGCYAKCIDLTKEKEPVIYDAIKKGAVMENVTLQQDGTPDFSDDKNTKNTRAAYPRHHIKNCVPSNKAGIPNAVLFLTCDCYGVLPPVAMLNKEQAAYYFLSGYTALVGSTEMGSSSDIVSTFSTCFGAPFFPRAAQTYAELLIKRVTESNAQVYLINTGWTGGAYGHGGNRFPIPVTRSIVNSALSGELLTQPTTQYSGFNFKIPKVIPGVDDKYLDPAASWKDKEAYHTTRNQLIREFKENFEKFNISGAIEDSGPIVI